MHRPQGGRKYSRTVRYMGDRMVIGVVVACHCGFLWFFRNAYSEDNAAGFKSRSWNAKFCLHLQDEGHCTEPCKLTKDVWFCPSLVQLSAADNFCVATSLLLICLQHGYVARREGKWRQYTGAKKPMRQSAGCGPFLSLLSESHRKSK